ncbi:hypothetical protein BCR42DRAFT_446838 [Absidia repens]|uniref:BTB domain-containing protein n=1 Tax=Absidia repens TaxID=90262 RepID=A0A1X2IVQ6_9FUNG|nr:hypothetical protein BCR42DRAFT_446838 [Absidia repens]
MITDMTTNYNQQHIQSPNFKSSGYIAATGNGAQYYQQGASPSIGHQQATQSLPMPMNVPMMNHHMPIQHQQHHPHPHPRPHPHPHPHPHHPHPHPHPHHHHPHHHQHQHQHPPHLPQQHQPTFFASPVPSRPTPVNANYAYNEPDPQTYCNYLYQVGFIQGNFSDVTVSIPSIAKSFTLHSLILSRSPYLYQRLINLQQDDNAMPVIELDYGHAMTESFHTVFTHLYRPLSHQEMTFIMSENPKLYLELIDIADYLELPLKDILLHVILSQGFNETSAMRLVRLLQPFLSAPSPLSMQQQQPQQDKAIKMKAWVQTLDEQLLHYLTRGLSTQLEAFSTSVKMSGGVVIGKNPTYGYMASKTIPLRGMTDLAKLYATLPWVYLKRCLEHDDLPVQDTIQRYYFAKKVLQLRSALPTPNEAQEQETQTQGPITIGLLFDDHQPGNVSASTSTTTTASTSAKKRVDDKDNMAMTLSLIKSRRRKLGKWNPSLYEEYESDNSDQEP